MAKGQGRKKNSGKQGSVSWAQALRDIVITSMNRGQLPILGVIGLFLLVVWKMPGEDVSKLAFDIVAKLQAGELWAYILLVIALIGWYVHARIMRKEFSDEYRRIGREKSEIQSKVAGVNFKSSDQS